MVQETKSVRFGLRFKVAGVTSLAMLIMGSLLGYLSSSSSKEILQAEIQKRGRALAGNAAQNGEFALLANNKEELRKFTKGILAQEDVAYVYFINAKTKQIVVSGANPRDGSKRDYGKSDEDFVGPPDMKGTFDALKADPDQVKDVYVREVDRNDAGHILDIAAPIFYRVTKDDSLLFGPGGEDDSANDDSVKKTETIQRIGHVQVGFYLKGTEAEVRKVAVKSFLLVLIVLAIAVFLVVLFVRFAFELQSNVWPRWQRKLPAATCGKKSRTIRRTKWGNSRCPSTTC